MKNETGTVESKASLSDFFLKVRRNRDEQSTTIEPALAAMDRLAIALQGRSGQPCDLRSLLYSLYNGQPASLLEIVTFDWPIRKDLICVLYAFGHAAFFYDEMKASLVKAGTWEWFIKAHRAEDHRK